MESDDSWFVYLILSKPTKTQPNGNPCHVLYEVPYYVLPI